MKIIKNILLVVALMTAFAAQGAVISTNLPATNAVSLLTTNRASVYQIQLESTVAGTIHFYDCDSVADPYFGTNYVNAAYVSRTSYATNLVTSYVGTTGVTNWYTNAGLFTLNVTNAANTNQLPRLISLVYGANQATTYNIDALFVRGITALSSTNVGVVLYYRPGN